MSEFNSITLGTKEHVIVKITDKLGELTTLDGANARFDLRKKGASTWVSQNVAVTNIGMTAYCLIDTQAWTEADVGKYELYIYFNALPEVPRLGPFEFSVNP
jgi:hypothetical protein